MEEAGDVTTLPVDPGETMSLFSADKKQVMAVYFSAGSTKKPVQVSPAALLLPPLIQWDSKYQFNTLPISPFMSYEVC